MRDFGTAPALAPRAPAPTPGYPPLPVWFARIFVALIRREMLEISRYRLAALTRVFTFAFGVVALYFFAQFVGAAPNHHLTRYGGDYLAFGIVGLIAADLQHVGLSALSKRVRMAQVMGYLEAQLATPAPAWLVLGGSPLYDFGASALRSIAYLVGASLLFGVSFTRARLDTLALVAVLVFLAFVGLGMLTAAATLLARRSNPVATILGALSVFLSGVAYPVSVLPPWLQGASRLLPLTHALEALRRTLLLGASPAELTPTLVALAIFAAVLTPSGLALFVYGLRRARIDGSLTHY
jgi:ABC-2 type transport system permease protein